MLGQDPSMKMNNRSGLPVKNIVTAIFILLSIYLLYIYNVAQNRLHDAEMTGSRYRREAEEKANEIQGLISAKDDFQERCETEKREFSNRLKSVNQKYSMLQSQNTEIEADFMKLKQDMENLRAEHMQTESQHAQEYQTLKQAKEKEISDLSVELATVKKQNEDLQMTVSTLQSQIQNHEIELQKALLMVQNLQSAKQNLLDQNAKLQMAQFQQQKQLELQKQNEENAMKAKELQQQQQINFVPEQQGGQLNQNNLNTGNNINNPDGVNAMSQNNQAGHPGNAAVPGDNVDNKAGDGQQAEKIDALNSLNQAKPPNMGGVPGLEEDKVQVEQKEDEHRPDVNPNDLQQGQILEPLKPDGGEADADGRMNRVREVEEKREREELENEVAEHKNPLDLGQMQQPMDLGLGGHERLGGNDGKQGQQQPPVFMDQVQQKQGNENDEAGLEDDQKQYYQNREEEDGDDAAEDNDDDANDNLEVEDEAVDVNNIDKAKAVDDQLNAWQHFNMAPHVPLGVNNNNNNVINKPHLGNINNFKIDSNHELDLGKYDDKEEEEEEDEDDERVEEEEEVEEDDDYGANLDGVAAAAAGPLNGADV